MSQATGGPWKVGVLWDVKTAPPRILPLSDWLLEDLKTHGFAERDLQLVVRQVEEPARLREAARSLIGERVQVLWAPTIGAALAAKAETQEIPIVFGIVPDPVRLGLVASIAKPGGNATGMMTQFDLLAPKRLELLREIVPRIRRVLVPVDPEYAVSTLVLPELREAARRLGGIRLVEHSMTDKSDVEQLGVLLRRERIDGLLHNVNPAMNQNFELALQAIHAAKVPDMIFFVDAVERGLALAGYGSSYREIWRASARLVARILRGTKPADLPVESRDVIELHVNLRVARERGIEVPQAILQRAHKVIR